MAAITRGTTATVTLTGTTGPSTSGANWEIRKGGVVVATSLSPGSAPNAWAVSRTSSTTASITVPATAATSPDSSTEDYEVRHNGLADAPGGTEGGIETP